MSPPEVQRLFEVLRGVRASGRSIVFISHFLDDVLAISDTVTIFRNGRLIATEAAGTVDKGWLIQRMIGRGHEELEGSYTGAIALDSRPDAPVVLDVRGLGAGRAFADVSLDVRAGEVLGIYGFMGCGLIELARTLFGKLKADAGTMSIGGKVLAAAQHGRGLPRRHRLRAGEPPLDALPHRAGLQEHVDQRAGPHRPPAAAALGREGHRPPACPVAVDPSADVETLLGSLSGGNQQKVALAKWLTWPPKVLVLSEPTRGMDVGAKEDVVRIVKGLREQGMGVVVLSTEPETVLSLADRIVVMKKGRIVREFAGETVSKDQLLEAA